MASRLAELDHQHLTEPDPVDLAPVTAPAGLQAAVARNSTG
jgi:hypothetical protein